LPAHRTTQLPEASGSTGIVVLGMHRSGTSALAHLLHAAGADLGERVLPASAGNELGHWEDAFAVETNERLLSALGRRWDDVRPLPAGWRDAVPAREAHAGIVDYVRGTRLRHAAWALKDPRMCLFAPLWLDALRDAGARTCALLLARHPQEVAASLAARDGMAVASADLLWARYMLEAERATRAVPRAVLTYEDLLASPADVLARVRALPGADALRPVAARDAVQSKARHHRSGGATLAPLVGAAWEAFAAPGGPDTAALDRCADQLAAADRLYAPVLAEIERTREELWLRTGRAEAALAAGSPPREAIEAVSGGVERVLAAVSGDLARMEVEHAKALETAASLAARAGLAQEIAPGLHQVRDGLSEMGHRMSDAIGSEIRRMQEEHARALAAVSEISARASIADALAPAVEGLRQALEGEMHGLRQDLASRDGLVARLRQDLAAGEALVARLRQDLAAGEALVEQQQQRLVQQQQQLAQLQHQLPLLQADAELMRQMRASRSWRLTRPLRFAARLLRGEAGGADRDWLRRWWGLRLGSMPLLPHAYRERLWRQGHGTLRVVADAPEAAIGTGTTMAHAPALLAPAPAGDRPDVFIWAVIDWHFRTQRPQHLARGLVEAGHRVFYLSNNLVDAAEPGFDVEALDDGGRLFQVFLNAEGAPAIYHGTPSAATVAQLRRSDGELMQWAGSDGGLCIVQHPFWNDVASRLPGAALLYDCMDHHAGFEDNAPDVLAAEAALTREADMLVVTSEWLDRELAGANPHRVLIRNAGDFAHFRDAPAERYRDRDGRRIIGYYGAIAEWFDVGLVRAVARANPGCLVLLVGNDTAGAAAQLADEPNVAFTGEVPYARLPYYLHAFDVALLPFRIIPLTLATNPVKVYEYLSAGKPVVAVDLPEMHQFGDLVLRAADQDAFVARVADALREQGGDMAARRRAFASEQTWVHRAQELDAAIAALAEPLVSVVVLTYNNLEFTRACLRSLVEESNWRNLEIVVVDNASIDGSREFLREWAEGGPGRRVILNDANLGFAAGNNVGLAAATGDYLVLLNNDTYVTPNWVRTMVNHLKRNPDIGILGPVTNNIGNEAKIDIHYDDMEAMKRAAAAWTRRHAGIVFDLRTVAFFCVAMPRSTWERVGPLDEAFGIGFFEDDDYCRRVEAAGLRVACADDVFVHHHLSASFDALKAERKRELFERNKAIYEAKWGPWVPHAYRRH
jgi:GT2 family glycosyltransferase/glycosyltransferase involved in cell wall biosynthesis